MDAPLVTSLQCFAILVLQLHLVAWHSQIVTSVACANLRCASCIRRAISCSDWTELTGKGETSEGRVQWEDSGQMSAWWWYRPDSQSERVTMMLRHPGKVSALFVSDAAESRRPPLTACSCTGAITRLHCPRHRRTVANYTRPCMRDTGMRVLNL